MFKSTVLVVAAILTFFITSAGLAKQTTIEITNLTGQDIRTHADGSRVEGLDQLQNALIPNGKQASFKVNAKSAVFKSTPWFHIWYSWANGNSDWVWGLDKITYLSNKIPLNYICPPNSANPCAYPTENQTIYVTCPNAVCDEATISITIHSGVGQ